MQYHMKRVSYWRYQLVKRPRAIHMHYTLLRKVNRYSSSVGLLVIAWKLTRYVWPKR